MGTIVQEYGPLYGEAVNGTVSGRPNGSVYVPLSNIITLSLPENTYIRLIGGQRIRTNNANFVIKANAQDLASNLAIALYTDSDCETLYSSTRRAFSAGIFTVEDSLVCNSTTTPTNNETYYLRAEMYNNNTLIAVSNVVEVLGSSS